MAVANHSRLQRNRRRFLSGLSSIGLGATLLPGALTAVAQEAEEITATMVGEAARVAGLSFSDDELGTIAGKLNDDASLIQSYEGMRQEEIPNSLAPALLFNPLPTGFRLPTERRPMKRSAVEMPSPNTDEDLAFLPATQLARLLESQAVTSVELTQLYLSRLKVYDPKLHCVVSLTEDLALEQARRADQEIAAGYYRGPLHGVPWGAKDLLAVRGYPTTWGASPYRDRTIDNDAAVYERLRDAGAVLVAKLSMGALAQGDRWFGGLTRNPWKLDQGSSGSSAGPGSATAAGLVGFSIGTETRGSIISPSRRCGVTGLRPTFGRVSRYGAMTLSWSMDKIGPMCRSAEDCALVLDAINGRDDRDASTFDVPFNWDATTDVRRLRVGYLRNQFEEEIPDDPQNPGRAQRRREDLRIGREALGLIRELGVEVQPIELDLMTQDLDFVLGTEAAAAFDALAREDGDDSMRQAPETSNWPDSFRLHRIVPAVEYIQANRLRAWKIEQLHEVFQDIDLFVGSSLGLTNLTGHPEISIPYSLTALGTPGAFSLTGKLFGEEEILQLAQAFQAKYQPEPLRPTAI